MVKQFFDTKETYEDDWGAMFSITMEYANNHYEMGRYFYVNHSCLLDVIESEVKRIKKEKDSQLPPIVI